MGMQLGVILGRKRRRKDERDHIRGLFIRMLMRSADHSPYSSGIALVKTDGSYGIFKRPVRAHELLCENRSRELMEQIDNETTILMGYTSMYTLTTPKNQPYMADDIIGTEDSVIYNADEMFKRFALPHLSGADSELIFRLADRCITGKSIDLARLNQALAHCRGQMSAVLASKVDPGTITVLKGTRPLSLRVNDRRRIVLYASDVSVIDIALGGENGWRELQVPPMSILMIRYDDILDVKTSEFRFKGE